MASVVRTHGQDSYSFLLLMTKLGKFGVWSNQRSLASEDNTETKVSYRDTSRPWI